MIQGSLPERPTPIPSESSPSPPPPPQSYGSSPSTTPQAKWIGGSETASDRGLQQPISTAQADTSRSSCPGTVCNRGARGRGGRGLGAAGAHETRGGGPGTTKDGAAPRESWRVTDTGAGGGTGHVRPPQPRGRARIRGERGPRIIRA